MADKILEALRLVAENGPLERVVEGSDDVAAVAELHESGMVTAIKTGGLSRASFMNVMITTRGREYLKTLEREAFEASPRGRLKRFVASLGVHTATVITSVIASVVAAVVTTVVMRKLGG